MELRKITVGYVIQTFDTEKKCWVDQEFKASDDVTWEDDKGNALTVDEASEKIGLERFPYLPFMMIEPKHMILEDETSRRLTMDNIVDFRGNNYYKVVRYIPQSNVKEKTFKEVREALQRRFESVEILGLQNNNNELEIRSINIKQMLNDGIITLQTYHTLKENGENFFFQVTYLMEAQDSHGSNMNFFPL